MNRRGLATGLLFITAFFFLVAILNIISITAWNSYNNIIQSQDNATISPAVKEKIDAFTGKMLWADKMFVMSYFIMLLSYLITARTIARSRPEVLFIFFVFLIIVSIFAMMLSNGWAYLKENPNLVAAAAELPMTDFIIHYYPVNNLIIGFVGMLLFFSRARDDEGLIGGESGGEPVVGVSNGFMSGGRGDGFE